MNIRKDVKKQVLAGLFWKFSERIIAQLISLIVSIILARMLEPTDYGAVSLVMVFITIANVFVSSGLGSALIQKKDADNLDFSSVLFINIVMGLILYLVLFFIAPYVATFYNMPILAPVLRVLGIRIPVAAVNSVQHAYVSRNMLFKRFFWSTLFGTLFSGIVGIAMAFQGWGVWALVAQYLVNCCTDTVVLWITIKWRPQFKYSWERAKGLVKYGWKILVSGLIDSVYSQLRSLIIGKLYRPESLAFYNQGDKYPSLIVININASISGVLFPAIAQFQDDTEKMKQMTRRAIQVSSFVMWPMMIGLAVVAEPFVELILTDKWLSCVPYLRIFCFSYGLWPIHTANLQVLNAMGRSDLYLRLEIIKKAVGIITLIITMQYGTLAIAWGVFFTGITSTFINSSPNKKLLNYTYYEQLQDLLPGLLLSGIMALLIYPLHFLEISSILLIILQVLLGGSIYLLLAFFIKQPTFLYLLSFVKKKHR